MRQIGLRAGLVLSLTVTALLGSPVNGQESKREEEAERFSLARERELFIPKKTPQEVLASPEAQATIESFLREYYKEYRFPKHLESILLRHEDGTVRVIFGGDTMEIVREDEQFYYLRHLPIEDTRSSAHRIFNTLLHYILADYAQKEYRNDMYFLETETFVPPPFTDLLEFQDHSRGLPDSALWQMNLDVADFDGDGRPDILLPPPRKGDGRPHIFLQRESGWVEWSVRWPSGVDLDYGGVAAADFDGDGKMDFALASHFKRVCVFYGDGKGDFTRFQVLPKFPTSSRAVVAGDFNRDGRPDLAVLAELDVNLDTKEILGSFLLTVCINDPGETTWRCRDATPPGISFFGDGLAVQDIDQDGFDDVVISSRLVGNMTLMFLNRDSGTRWEPITSRAFPFAPGVPAVGSFPQRDGRVVLGVWQRESRDPGAGKRDVQALLVLRGTAMLVADPADARAFEVEEVNIFERQWDSYGAVATGDFDGDGVPDIVAGRESGVIQVFLRRDKEWMEERPSFTVSRFEPGRIFALRAVDLNGDGRCDVVGIAKEGEAMRVFALLTRPRTG